jgi:4-hydroxy-2-oxoheptanedioate aldolase
VRACELAGTASLARVPWLEAGAIAKALDTACDGVIVPCIDSVEEARAAVDAAKFPPPLGRRSYGARRQIDRQGRTYADSANHEQLLVVQIESPKAADAAEQIAAVPGIDALMIGPDDLLLRRGIDLNAPRSPQTLGSDLERIAQAAHSQRKLLIGLGSDEPMISLLREFGYHMIISGGDVLFLANGSSAAAKRAPRQLRGRRQRAALPAAQARIRPRPGGHARQRIVIFFIRFHGGLRRAVS